MAVNGPAILLPAILLTGAPGVGKTTAIRRVVAAYPGPAGGFYTEEIRLDGQRRGFKIVTLDGQAAVLAHVDYAKTVRVGRYGVDLDALEAVGVTSIIDATAGGGLVVIDEIGPMENLSVAFQEAVLAALASEVPVLGTIVRRREPFADRVKALAGVTVLTLTRDNRDSLVDDVLARLG